MVFKVAGVVVPKGKLRSHQAVMETDARPPSPDTPQSDSGGGEPVI